MVLETIASEDIQKGNFVSVLFSDSSQISCRTAFASEPPDAVAARDIAKGEVAVFDTGRDTDDLLRPSRTSYKGG
jgi:hypothetical protein